VCMFDNFYFTFNLKSKVLCDVFINKMNVDCHSQFFLRCHLNVTCLLVCVISISKVSINVWFFLHNSHYMSKSKLCVSIDVQFIYVQVFACQMSKTCNIFVKTTHWPHDPFNGIYQLGEVPTYGDSTNHLRAWSVLRAMFKIEVFNALQT